MLLDQEYRTQVNTDHHRHGLLPNARISHPHRPYDHVCSQREGQILVTMPVLLSTGSSGTAATLASSSGSSTQSCPPDVKFQLQCTGTTDQAHPCEGFHKILCHCNVCVLEQGVCPCNELMTASISPQAQLSGDHAK